MELVNPSVQTDIAAAVPIRLNLGGGNTIKEGFYNVDLVKLPGVDIVADLNHPLTAIPDDSVEEVYSRHTLEHVANFLGLMDEIHRITTEGAAIKIVVPHVSNPYAYSDPTHTRFFGLYSFYYFSIGDPPNGRRLPRHYSQSRFRLKRIHIAFYQNTLLDRIIVPPIQRMVNRSFATLDTYERYFCWIFPAWQISYTLQRGP